MNQKPLFNDNWHRISELCPRLAPDVEVSRHVYRKRIQYLLYRRSTRNTYRVNPETYDFLSRLNGRVTVQDAWQQCLSSNGNTAPDQTDTLTLIAELNEADLLILDKRQRSETLFQQKALRETQAFKQKLLNPLFVKFNLANPDRLLSNISESLTMLSLKSMTWFVIPTLLLLLLLVPPQLQELTNQTHRVFSSDQRFLLFLLVIYPVMKVIHELAHGIVIKRFKGDVKECGIALMVLLPIPYVDASSSVVMENKWHRIMISGAGIAAELLISSIAILVCLMTDGLVSDIALMTTLVGIASSLLVNGNPLLKFDAYYMLSDYLEIPNLHSKARDYLKKTIRNIYREDRIFTDNKDIRQRCWLVGYAITSAVYRFFLLLAIALMLSGQMFFIGVAMASWICWLHVIKPGFKAVRMITAEIKASNKSTPKYASLGLIAATSILIFLPISNSQVLRGELWLPDDSIVRVSYPCVVTDQYQLNGTYIKHGTALVECTDKRLRLQLDNQYAHLNELRAELYGFGSDERTAKSIAQKHIDTIESEIALTESKIAEQSVKAQVSGTLYYPGQHVIRGQFVTPENPVAYIIPENTRLVEVLIPERGINSIRNSEREVSIGYRDGNSGFKSITSKLIYISPIATTRISAVGFSDVGGGALETIDRDGEREFVEPVFSAKLNWPRDTPPPPIGSSVAVRLETNPISLAMRVFNGLVRSVESRSWS